MPTFDDDELERYYRRIEARTQGDRAADGRPRPDRRRRGSRNSIPRQDQARENAPRGSPPEPCPTPDKEGYAGSDAAWLAVAVLRAGRVRTPDLDVYRCRCGLWHITSRGRS